MSLVVKKRLSLVFLGKEYADDFINFKAIGVAEYEALEKSKKTVKETTIDHFIDGQITQDGESVKITNDNIQELPGEVFVEGFKLITGQIDPKDLGLLTKQSPTEQSSPQN